MKVITTIPPYAPFLDKIAKHDIISGVRLNTIMPTREPLDVLLTRLQKIMGKKDVWIDLKCRQIRISYGSFFNSPVKKKYHDASGKEVVLDSSSPKASGELRSPPWASIKIDRKIKLDLSKGPVKCWFQDGTDSAYIVDVINGDELIMLDGPKRVVGGGESINILHPSLEIEGFLTSLDVKYIEAAKKAGLHKYMLSFVEKDSDIADVLKLDEDAEIVVKIESEKGVSWVNNNYKVLSDLKKIRLMAARGDLYTEVGMKRPEKIFGPLKNIIDADMNAILASRILSSLRSGTRPSCSDITDIYCMLGLGYETFMMGDEICFNEDGLMLALDIMKAIGEEYEFNATSEKEETDRLLKSIEMVALDSEEEAEEIEKPKTPKNPMCMTEKYRM